VTASAPPLPSTASVVHVAPPAAAARRRDPRKSEFELAKLKKRLRRLVGQAIADYSMIDEGDRVMVCVSGGKDSYGLLDVLLSLQARAPKRFAIVAVNLDQKQPGFPADVLPRYLAGRGVEFRIAEQDTYSVVKRVIPEGATMCSLCSRLRRGVLYRMATELGATRIALGHHRDDLLATFFLNLFHGGKLKTMPPKRVSDDGRHVVIRPLASVRFRSFPARCADRRRTCSAGRSRTCFANGRSATPDASNRSSTRWATWCRRTCSIAACRTSPRCARRTAPSPTATAPSMPTNRRLQRTVCWSCPKRILRDCSSRTDGATLIFFPIS
jgi:hypothetical protein